MREREREDEWGCGEDHFWFYCRYLAKSRWKAREKGTNVGQREIKESQNNSQ